MTTTVTSVKAALYVGVFIAFSIFTCAVVIIVILLVRRGRFSNIVQDGTSSRCLFLRGFSTVSQRGVIDSTSEFEIINMCVNSEEGSGKKRCLTGGPPKEPERKWKHNSGSNVKYENVSIDPKAGLVIEKSASMLSVIPYIDNIIDSRISEKDDENDDVFE